MTTSVVVGGNSGIGRFIAERLAAQGNAVGCGWLAGRAATAGSGCRTR